MAEMRPYLAAKAVILALTGARIANAGHSLAAARVPAPGNFILEHYQSNQFHILPH